MNGIAAFLGWNLDATSTKHIWKLGFSKGPFSIEFDEEKFDEEKTVNLTGTLRF